MILPMYVARCEAFGCDTQTWAFASRAELRVEIAAEGWTYTAAGGHRCPGPHQGGPR